MSMERTIIEKLTESRMDEDWRDGKFEDKDMARYSAEMKEKARAILFSIDMMQKKHPEYANEFRTLKFEIKKMF